MSNEVINTYQTFYDDAGIPLANGTITFYVNLTTTNGTIFSDEALTIAQSNPYTLDAYGRINGDVKFTGKRTLLIKDSIGSTIRTIDNVTTMFDSSTLTLAFSKNFATLAAAVANTNLVDGDVLNIAERTTGNGGGAMWDVVLSSTVTENTFNIVQCIGVATLSLVLRIDGRVTTRSFGANESITDNILALESVYASPASTVDFQGDMLGISDELEITKTTYGNGGGVKMITLNTTIENVVVIRTDNINLYDFTGDGQATITPNVPNIDPTPWTSGNFNSFLGGQKALSINSTDNVKLIRCVGKNSAGFAGIRGTGCTNLTVTDCKTVRTRGNFGDGFYFPSCTNLTVRGCTAEDFTRIGFVTEDDSYNSHYINCHAFGGHDPSVIHGGGEFSAGFWAESSSLTSYVSCIADNTLGTTQSRGFKVANNRVINTDSPNTNTLVDCLVFDFVEGFSLSAFITDQSVNIVAMGCSSYIAPLIVGSGFVVALSHGGSRSSVKLIGCYAEAHGIGSNSAPYRLAGDVNALATGSPKMLLDNCTSYLHNYDGFLHITDKGGDVVIPTSSPMDLVVKNLQSRGGTSAFYFDSGDSNISIYDTRVTHTTHKYFLCNSLNLTNCDAEISFTGAVNSTMNLVNVSIVPDTIETGGIDQLTWNVTDLLSGDLTLDETQFRHVNAFSGKGVVSKLNITCKYDVTASALYPIEYNYIGAVKPTAILNGTLFNTGGVTTSNSFVHTDAVNNVFTEGLIVDDTVTNTIVVNASAGAIANETKVAF